MDQQVVFCFVLVDNVVAVAVVAVAASCSILFLAIGSFAAAAAAAAAAHVRWSASAVRSLDPVIDADAADEELAFGSRCGAHSDIYGPKVPF